MASNLIYAPHLKMWLYWDGDDWCPVEPAHVAAFCARLAQQFGAGDNAGQLGEEVERAARVDPFFSPRTALRMH